MVRVGYGERDWRTDWRGGNGREAKKSRSVGGELPDDRRRPTFEGSQTLRQPIRCCGPFRVVSLESGTFNVQC